MFGGEGGSGRGGGVKALNESGSFVFVVGDPAGGWRTPPLPLLRMKTSRRTNRQTDGQDTQTEDNRKDGDEN